MTYSSITFLLSLKKHYVPTLSQKDHDELKRFFLLPFSLSTVLKMVIYPILLYTDLRMQYQGANVKRLVNTEILGALCTTSFTYLLIYAT